MTDFEWDRNKDMENREKHGISFYDAQYAFFDVNRVIAEDSQHEKRFYCFGLNQQGTGILTVRCTHRNSRIRILGAGYW
jgi:uncharacterized DUF497 family protein